MPRLAALLLLFFAAVSSEAIGFDGPLYEGYWGAGGRAFLGYDFSIAKKEISFPDQHCWNNPIEIMEAFDGPIKDLFGQVEDYFTYVMNIKFTRSAACDRVKRKTGEYIRMSILKRNICHSSTNFYRDLNRLEIDRANNWDGNHISGWSVYGNRSDDRSCKSHPTDHLLGR